MAMSSWSRALSWALRELIPHDPAALIAFIEQHEASLNRRVLREVQVKLTTGRKNGSATVQRVG